jgi:hypothetical protein
MIATPNEDWIIRDWKKPIELWEGEMIQLTTLLKAKGIKV